MSFLADILARKRDEVESARRATPDAELRARARDRAAPRPFEAALSFRGGPPRVIAEVKRASPSAGAIRPALDAVAQARAYAAAGAAAISVLTDGPGFGGSLADLSAIRAAVDAPLLRKDFVLDRYQLLEARAHGADAALLIVAALDPSALARLVEGCGELGLAALVEVHDEAEVEGALRAGARLIGVNNRNLKTFSVDLAVSERIVPRLPDDVRAVAESGVKSADDARRLRRAGAVNLLVGTALVVSNDPGALLREMST